MPRCTWRSLSASPSPWRWRGAGPKRFPGCGWPRQGPRPRPGWLEAQNATNSSRRTALVVAADRVAPAVVSINVTSRQQAERRSPFDFFFVPEGARVVQGYGTGFVIRPSGIIVTNQHVVANAERVVVTLPDGSDLPATVLGEDPLTDIAVLRRSSGRTCRRSRWDTATT